MLANVGVGYRRAGFNAAVSGHFQGEVKRRALDLYGADELAPYGNAQPRPSTLDAWFGLDVNLNYQATSNVALGLSATNLLDGENAIAKTQKNPFDYQSVGRRVMGQLKLTLD